MTIAICVVVCACSSLTGPASATRAHVQSLVDEEVALRADHLQGEVRACIYVDGSIKAKLKVQQGKKRISPVGTLDIGDGCCQWAERVHHRQHSLPAPREVECP